MGEWRGLTVTMSAYHSGVQIQILLELTFYSSFGENDQIPFYGLLEEVALFENQENDREALLGNIV